MFESTWTNQPRYPKNQQRLISVPTFRAGVQGVEAVRVREVRPHQGVFVPDGAKVTSNLDRRSEKHELFFAKVSFVFATHLSSKQLAPGATSSCNMFVSLLSVVQSRRCSEPLNACIWIPEKHVEPSLLLFPRFPLPNPLMIAYLPTSYVHTANSSIFSGRERVHRGFDFPKSRVKVSALVCRRVLQAYTWVARCTRYVGLVVIGL